MTAPPRLIEIVQAAREAGDLNRFIAAIPYAQFLGISASAENGVLTARLASSDRIIGNPALPAIHGGAVGAFLETTAILQLLWTLDSIRIPKTITITIDYLRTAGPHETFARAEVTKLGSRVANVRAFAWQADANKPVAGANANFLIMPADEE
ncbi:MAG: PaaI family thioesterase [Rhodospirillaceae bacterium]|nr:PaaI family thioesterase [Rhodospirillaceae bacterium]